MYKYFLLYTTIAAAIATALLSQSGTLPLVVAMTGIFVFIVIDHMESRPASPQAIAALIEQTEASGNQYSIWMLQKALKEKTYLKVHEFNVLKFDTEERILNSNKVSDLQHKRLSDVNHQKIDAFIAKELP